MLHPLLGTSAATVFAVALLCAGIASSITAGMAGGSIFAGIFGLLQSAVIIQSLRADHGDFTPGANINASGLGTALALAERLRAAPLQNTEVWVACCGSHTAAAAACAPCCASMPMSSAPRGLSASKEWAWAIG